MCGTVQRAVLPDMQSGHSANGGSPWTPHLRACVTMEGDGYSSSRAVGNSPCFEWVRVMVSLLFVFAGPVWPRRVREPSLSATAA
jgi:hypothetical protein